MPFYKIIITPFEVVLLITKHIFSDKNLYEEPLMYITLTYSTVKVYTNTLRGVFIILQKAWGIYVFI